MTKRVVVEPLDDGVNQRSSWQVKVSGVRKSTHTKKSAAVNEARRQASPGDQLIIKGTDGTILENKTYQGSQSGSNVGSNGHAWDVDHIQESYDNMTDIL